MKTKHPDAELIDNLGGPTKVAEMMGFDLHKGGVQRVTNWKSRGIPSLVRLNRPDLFADQPASVSDAA